MEAAVRLLPCFGRDTYNRRNEDYYPYFCLFLSYFFDNQLEIVIFAGECKSGVLSSAADLVNKGSITEMVAGLETTKYLPPTHRPELFYWQREAKGSTAEIDYLIAKDMQILPIEVKAGTQGGMKSLYYYMEQKDLQYAIRASLENFGQIKRESSAIDICPLYALSSLFQQDK